MRITDELIEGEIESFVNCIYDTGEDSGWVVDSKEEWIKAVWGECVSEKTYAAGCIENRFDGKENTIKRIDALLKKRMVELHNEGYSIQCMVDYGIIDSYRKEEYYKF